MCTIIITVYQHDSVVRYCFVKIHRQRKRRKKKKGKTKPKIDSKSRLVHGFDHSLPAVLKFDRARTRLQSETGTKTSPVFFFFFVNNNWQRQKSIIISFRLLLYRWTVRVYYKPFAKVEREPRSRAYGKRPTPAQPTDDGQRDIVIKKKFIFASTGARRRSNRRCLVVGEFPHAPTRR